MNPSYRQTEFYSFSRTRRTTANEFRPERAKEIPAVLKAPSDKGILCRGNGMSYNDSCLNDGGSILNTRHFNHFLKFDKSSASVQCQPAVKLLELFQLHQRMIPAVVPGSLNISIGGAIAHDVHGKNQYRQGSFGTHVQSIELNTGHSAFHCSKEKNIELFKATIAGAGLTGFIQQATIKLLPSSQVVEVQQQKYSELTTLLTEMRQGMEQFEYQAAWLDLLNKPRAVLLQANAIEHPQIINRIDKSYSLPPLRLIYPGFIKAFNRFYYHASRVKTPCPFIQFNQPLDKITNWNRLYGKKGLIQFQGLFSFENAQQHLAELLDIIKKYRATPCLAVLKTLGHNGEGYLSFCKPGFTIAVDFIHNEAARKAILSLNDYLCRNQGKVYLAKDMLLTREQFEQMYPEHEAFKAVLAEYQSPLRSDLGRRLGLCP